MKNEWLGEEKDTIIEQLMAENAELKQLVAQFQEEIRAFREQNAKLLARLKMNSCNSSKPPFLDEYRKPSPVRLREKFGKYLGVQKGLKVPGLSLLLWSDKVIKYIPSACERYERKGTCLCPICDIRVISETSNSKIMH